MRTSVDESKNFSLILEKVNNGHIFLLLQLCSSRPHRYVNFQFCSLSVITASYNVPTSHISKTHLHLVSLNVYKLELN